MSNYVMHDGHRWRVIGETDIDGEPGYDLVRRTLTRTKKPDGAIVTRPRMISILARVVDCEPDQHERIVTIRDGAAVLKFNTVRRTVIVKPRRSKKGYTTTVSGILAMCARQAAANRARDRAFKRRTRKS